MQTTSVYILISILVFAIIIFITFLTGSGFGKQKISPLASLSFAFIIAGIFFDDNRWLGYALMGLGIAFAIADIIKKTRLNNE
jgi:hypothetical protein